MIKLPRIGNSILNFKYLTTIRGNELEVDLILIKKNCFGANVHHMQNYVLKTDSRFSDINNIKSAVDGMLSAANGVSKPLLTIEVDSVRSYVHFNDVQFTGDKVL